MTGTNRFTNQNERLVIEGDLDIRSTTGGRLLVDGVDQTAGLSASGGSTAPVADASFTIGAEAAHVRRVTVQLLDGDGASASGYFAVGVLWLATGSMVPDYPDDSKIATKGYQYGDGTQGGAGVGDLDGAADGIQSNVFTDANGSFDVDVTKAAAGGLRMCVIVPTGELVVSSAITFAG